MLHIALMVGHSEVVKILLDGGADPSRRTPSGLTSIDIATICEMDQEIMDWLKVAVAKRRSTVKTETEELREEDGLTDLETLEE
jgi:hypothetical protein